jgi:hypothetical protein
MLPFLGLSTGASLGATLGGQSRTGNILGAIGGAGIGGALGMAAFTALGGLVPASLVPLLGILGPAALIAGPLLLAGAIILKKNAARRADEKSRNALMGDSLTQLTTLLGQVRRDKIGGDEALAQAASIRAQYITASSALKDTKTRNIALKDVSRLDIIIQQIKAAGAGQAKRRQMDDLLKPEFASGAYIMPNGVDTIHAMISPGEMVLNRQQQQAVGYHNLAKANVPNYVPSGNYGAGGMATPTSRYNSDREAGDVYIVADKEFAEKLAVKGRDKIISMTSADINTQGKTYSAIRGVWK